jgi:hypothetical protein
VERLYQLALDHWLERSNRLQRVAQRLQIAGDEICEQMVSPILGVAIVDLKAMQEALQPIARDRFGSEYRFYVTAVFADMASERAGLQVGDAVLKVNDVLLKAGKQFYGFRWPTGAVNRVEIKRNGESHTLEIDSEFGCRCPASVRFSESVNAVAHGNSISVHSALMRYYSDDASLALVVAHEIGHNIFPSPSASRRGGWASRMSEARVDYVGLHLTAIAGYPLVGGVFLKLGLVRDLERFSDKTSHPTPFARSIAERKTIEEIEGKMRRGEPLRLHFE